MNKVHWGWVYVVATLLWVVGCGTEAEPSVECGAGTELKDGTCVAKAVETTTCGDGTELKDGACVAKAVETTSCGAGTKLVDGACVVDKKALRPLVHAVSLTALSANLPDEKGLYVLHSTVLRARLSIDAEPFESMLVVGARSADGSKECAFGMLEVEHIGNAKGAPLSVSAVGRKLVQENCKDLVGAKGTTLFASFDPFLETQLAGRDESNLTDLKALITASTLGFGACKVSDDAQAPAGSPVQGGQVHCGNPVAVLANPGRDLTFSGSINYGDVELETDPEVSGDSYGGGGVVLEIETFDPRLVEAMIHPVDLAKQVTTITAGKAPTFAELMGSGRSTPITTGTAHYTVYGVSKGEAVEGEEISIEFTMRPAGAYADPNDGWVTVPTQLSLEGKAGEEPTIEELKEAFLASLQGIDLKTLKVPLFANAELREKLTIGAWQAHDIFELRGCLSATFKEVEGERALANNCQMRTAVIVRKEVVPSIGSLRVDPEGAKALKNKVDSKPLEDIPDQNPGGWFGRLKKMEASLPAADVGLFEAKEVDKNIGTFVIHVGAWGFVNMRQSTGESRLGEMLISPTINKGAGVYAHAIASGWGPMIDPVRWGDQPAIGAELLIARPWDQPITDGSFGTFEKFDVIAAAYLFGYEVFDYGFTLAFPNIGMPNEVTLFSVDFLKIFTAAIVAPGEGKNGLKFTLTAGLTKLPGQKGQVNKSQKSRKNLNRPDKVELVKIETEIEVGVEASITAERKGQVGSLPAGSAPALPARCSQGNNYSWVNAEKTRCYFVSSKMGTAGDAASRCAADGGKLYVPKMFKNTPDRMDYRWNIDLDKTFQSFVSNTGSAPTSAQIVDYAWFQDDPLAWVINLQGALAVRATRNDLAMWNFGYAGPLKPEKCSLECTWAPAKKACLWDPKCSVVAAYHGPARLAAQSVIQSLTSQWAGASESNRVYLNIDWPYNQHLYGDDDLWSESILAHWAKNPTWWQIARPGWMGHANMWAATLHLARGATFMTNGSTSEWPSKNGEMDSKDPMRDVMTSTPSTWNVLGDAHNGWRFRQHGVGNKMNWQDVTLLDDFNKRAGEFGRIVPDSGNSTARALCVASKAKLGGQDAESYSIIMTPGSEAAGVRSMSIGSWLGSFGAELKLVAYEFKMPIEFRAMRTKDNAKAELAIFSKATLDIFKLSFEVVVKVLGIDTKFKLVDMENGAYNKSWDIFGPVVSSYGCGGTSCNYTPSP